MAKATKKTEVKMVIKPVEEKTEVVVITLDKDEAQFLKDVLSNIAGSPDRSRRKYEQTISSALREVGFSYNNIGDLEGVIMFRDVKL